MLGWSCIATPPERGSNYCIAQRKAQGPLLRPELRVIKKTGKVHDLLVARVRDPSIRRERHVGAKHFARIARPPVGSSEASPTGAGALCRAAHRRRRTDGAVETARERGRALLPEMSRVKGFRVQGSGLGILTWV